MTTNGIIHHSKYKNKSNNLNEGQKREKDNLLAKHTRLQIIF